MTGFETRISGDESTIRAGPQTLFSHRERQIKFEFLKQNFTQTECDGKNEELLQREHSDWIF